jgi:hypothetical protein
VIATSGTTFNDQHGQDAANAGTQPRHGSGACDSYHDNWNYTLGGSLSGGTDGDVYEVQVTTTIAGKNLTTNAENMFGIMATGTGVQIYGQSRMCQYNNLAGTASGTTTQRFYMAKVDQPSGIGKTLQINLFDIGDSTAGSIQIISPNGPGGSQQQATFTYTTSSDCVAGKSDACSSPPGGVTSITVAKDPGGSSFNSTWIYISIDLGGNYGSAGLWGPAGNGLPATNPNAGWWQIQYNVQGGNDTTTWGVNVVGNPVHLVPIG